MIIDNNSMYKDDLSKYNNLLNYLSQNLHFKSDNDSLIIENNNEPDINGIKNNIPIMRDIQMGIPVDINIKVDDEKNN